MALENEQELIASMEELRRQMQGLGTDTAKANNAMTQFAQKTTSVGKAMGSVASELATGAGSFKSLGGVVDLTTKAVGGLLNIIPGVGGALKELAGAAGDAAKFVLQQFDDLAKNYQALGESSAITAKGLDGVQEQFRRMGLMTLPAFARAINQNTVAFTALGGTVAQGAEEFSKLAGAMTTGEIAEGFVKLGMSFDQIGESTGRYVAAFTRYGLTQGKTFEELRASTQSYLLEVDKIARITGVTAKQQEQEQQKNLANVQFRAKIEQMRAAGQVEAAAELEKYVNGLSGPLADAARATLTGVPLTEEAAMANLVMGNALSESTRNIMNGSKATTELMRAQQAAARGVETFGGIMQYTGDIAGGAGAQIFDLAAVARRQQELEASGMGTAEARAQAEQEELKRRQGATQDFANASQKTAQASKDLANLSFALVNAATPAVNAFATALQKVTGFIDKRFGGPPSTGTAPSAAGGAAKPASGNKKEFMDSMYNSLLAEAKKQGVANPEVIARLGVAQSALETGYGKSLAGGNNYFGIKARPGEGGPGMATQEFIGGRMVTVNDRFRRYGSMQESAADYIKFLKENPRYKDVLGAGTLEEAIAAQGRTGYATDPNYARKLSSIAGTMGPVSGYSPTITATGMTSTLGSAPSGPADLQNIRENNLVTVMSGVLDRLSSIESLNRYQLSVQEKTYRVAAS